MTIAIIDAQTYQEYRAIVDRANAYIDTIPPSRDGWRTISAEAAKHPDYAACNNDIRGKVEQYELLTDTPEAFTAYLQLPTGRFDTNYLTAQPFDVTIWTGAKIGTARMTARWKVNSFMGTHMHQFEATVSGRKFTGRSFGHGCMINLRETAASARTRAEKVAA